MQRDFKENYIHYLNTGKNKFFRVDLHMVGGCNFRCIMCDNWKNERIINFSIDDFKKYILILRKSYNCDYIRFHGQEPLLLPNIEKLILFAKRLGIKVAIKTNAWLLTKKRLTSILLAGLDELYLSIDGPNAEIHDKIRGVKGSFQKNIDTLILSKKIKPELKVYINSVIMKQNFACIHEMVDLGKRYFADRVSFVFLNDKNSKNIHDINLNFKEFLSFFKKDVVHIFKKSIIFDIPVDFSPFMPLLVLKDKREIIHELKNNFQHYIFDIIAFYEGLYGRKFYDRYGCFGPLDHSSINFDGNMYGCCVVERSSGVAVGNIENENFSEMWNDKKYQLYRKNSNENCAYGKKCASNFYTRKKLFKSIYLNEELYSKNNPRNYYRYLKELFYEDKKMILSIKIEKLKNILLFHYDSLPFYRELLEKNNICREDILGIQNEGFLKKLPILTKDILLENKQEIERLSSLRNDVVVASTSGSSGKRLNFVYPNNFKRYIKQIAIFSEESDFIFGDSFFALTPDNCNQFVVDNMDLPKYVKKIQLPVPDTFDFSLDYFEQILKIFQNSQNVKVLHADPKYLLYIILGFQKYNLSLPAFSLIGLTYSYSNQSLIRFFEKKLKTKIVSNYGCSEVGPISIDRNGFKNFGDNIFIYDDGGDIIVTDLDNYVFPFINYKNGDIGKVNDMGIEIFGKQGQVFYEKNLKEIDDFIFLNFPEIITYQFVNGDFVYISESKNYNDNRISHALLNFFGKKINIRSLGNDFFVLNNFCAKFNFIIE